MNAATSLPEGVATQGRAALDDDSLLSAFLKDGNDSAFRALAARHAGWVYAAAFRQLRDPHAAEDATQAVFVLLWRRGRGLVRKRKISGWLFRTVGYTVRAMKRTERRRQMHESRAALVSRKAADEVPPGSDDIDAAVAALGDADRMAILLRFYQGLEFADVARELGISPAAARQRVSRAVARLRARLGPEVSSGGIVSAVGCGAHPDGAAFREQVARAVVANARGAPLARGVETALKGATHLMAIANLKTAVAFVALAALLATSAAAVMTADDPADQAYALGRDEAIRQVLSTPAPERLEFLRRHSPPGARLDHPDGAMIVKWQDGRASLWGRKSSTQGWYTVADLVGHFVEVPPREFEGEQRLRNLRLRGDFAVKRKGPIEQYRAGIENIVSGELGKKVVLSFREVERPVVVFRGQWSYSPAEAGGKTTSIPTLDLYGTTLNPVPGREAEGTPQECAVAASDYIGQQVLFGCQGAPQQVRVRPSNPVGANPQKSLPPGDVDLVLRHIEEQTGLKAMRENRKVRRLFIEAD